ncbi:hypothetical protein B0H14DRAFT_2961987, partial [Mycena olivaceomarginata]
MQEGARKVTTMLAMPKNSLLLVSEGSSPQSFHFTRAALPHSPECQKKDWKEHKRSVCVKPALLHKFDKMVKKHSGPGSAMSTIESFERAAWAERVRNPQVISACDGCFRRFHGFPPREEEEEDENTPDAGAEFKHCKECDWTICEDCTHPQAQGVPFFDRPTGTCRCLHIQLWSQLLPIHAQLSRWRWAQTVSRRQTPSNGRKWVFRGFIRVQGAGVPDLWCNCTPSEKRAPEGRLAWYRI